jgi:hypothetical protein
MKKGDASYVVVDDPEDAQQKQVRMTQVLERAR